MPMMGGIRASNTLKRALRYQQGVPGAQFGGKTRPTGSMQFTGIDPYKRTSGMDVARRKKPGGRKKRGGVRRRGKTGGVGPDRTMT